MELDFPLELGLLITTLCNFRCVHCSSAQPNMPSIHMDKRTIFKVVEEAERLGILNINITGGEPFIHPDIWEVLERISLSEMQLHLNSNFSVLSRESISRLATLLHGGHLDVTIHSWRKGFGDFTGVSPKLYFKVIDNLKYAFELDIDVGVAITVNRMNQNVVPNIVKDVREISEDIPIVITLTHPTGRALLNWDKLRFNERDIFDMVMHTGFKNILVQRHYPPYNFTKEYLEKVRKYKLEHTGCPCGTFSMFIWPDGHVTWCPYSSEDPFIMGNIHDESIEAIWKKKQPNRIKSIREEISECKSCPFFHLCKGGCPIDSKNIRGNIYVRDPFCEEYLGDSVWNFQP